MEYSLKLIREVYGDIFGKSAGMVWGSLSKKRGEALCKTPENKSNQPLMYFWENLVGAHREALCKTPENKIRKP